MHMMSFDRKIWLLHRKLHHRFLRFAQCFVSATENLPEYKDVEKAPPSAASKSTETPVVSLMSSDSSDSDLDDSKSHSSSETESDEDA